MTNEQEQLAIVRQTIQSVNNGTTRVSELLQVCTRIARMRSDYVALYWLTYESTSFNSNQNFKAKVDAIASDFGLNPTDWYREAALNTYLDERSIHIPGEDNSYVFTLSVAEVEQWIENIQNLSSSLPSESVVHPFERDEFHFEISKTILTNTHLAQQLRLLLIRVQARFMDLLSKFESAILLGEAFGDSLQRTREYVETRLTEIAPASAGQLAAAVRRSNDGTSEDLSHALQSCRRLLESLADELYPARNTPVVGSDGEERILGKEKYIARLWQYIYEESGRHTVDELVMATANGLGDRIDALYKLTNKGVHAFVTNHDVDLCVTETYLVVAHLLHLAPQTVMTSPGSTQDKTRAQ